MALKLIAHTKFRTDGYGRVQVEMTIDDLRRLEARLKDSVDGWIEPDEYATIASFGEVMEELRKSASSQYPIYPSI